MSAPAMAFKAFSGDLVKSLELWGEKTKQAYMAINKDGVRGVKKLFEADNGEAKDLLAVYRSDIDGKNFTDGEKPNPEVWAGFHVLHNRIIKADELDSSLSPNKENIRRATEQALDSLSDAVPGEHSRWLMHLADNADSKVSDGAWKLLKDKYPEDWMKKKFSVLDENSTEFADLKRDNPGVFEEWDIDKRSRALEELRKHADTEKSTWERSDGSFWEKDQYKNFHRDYPEAAKNYQEKVIAGEMDTPARSVPDNPTSTSDPAPTPADHDQQPNDGSGSGSASKSATSSAEEFWRKHKKKILWGGGIAVAGVAGISYWNDQHNSNSNPTDNLSGGAGTGTGSPNYSTQQPLPQLQAPAAQPVNLTGAAGTVPPQPTPLTNPANTGQTQDPTQQAWQAAEQKLAQEQADANTLQQQYGQNSPQEQQQAQLASEQQQQGALSQSGGALGGIGSSLENALPLLALSGGLGGGGGIFGGGNQDHSSNSDNDSNDSAAAPPAVSPTPAPATPTAPPPPSPPSTNNSNTGQSNTGQPGQTPGTPGNLDPQHPGQTTDDNGSGNGSGEGSGSGSGSESDSTHARTPGSTPLTPPELPSTPKDPNSQDNSDSSDSNSNSNNSSPDSTSNPDSTSTDDTPSDDSTSQSPTQSSQSLAS